MALEDEIINISDIDVGTEILNNDKLIVETNNGTRLLAFKDFVIGEENITFADKLVQGIDPTTGESSTVTSSVTGYNILTSNTSPGHVTTYTDVSGTVELGKFNYNAVTKFAELSAIIKENQAEIDTLQSNLATITTLLNSTSALSGVAVTTKSVNFEVSNVGSSSTGSSKAAAFDTIDLDPSSTNDQTAFSSTDKFEITYPTDGSFTACRIMFIAELNISADYRGMRVYLYLNNAKKAEAMVGGGGRSGMDHANIQKSLRVSPGDTVKLVLSRRVPLSKGSTFSGYKL